MTWVKVESIESPGKTKSYVNYDEISVVQHVTARLRETSPWASIAVLTFYKGQHQQLMKNIPHSLRVEVAVLEHLYDMISFFLNMLIISIDLPHDASILNYMTL